MLNTIIVTHSTPSGQPLDFYRGWPVPLRRSTSVALCLCCGYQIFTR